jgi:hypothetical protein
MWWLYPRAVCYAFATTWIYKFIRGTIVLIAHVPENIEYFVDDFSWRKIVEYPKRFLRTIQSEKKKLEEYHLSKAKEE